MEVSIIQLSQFWKLKKNHKIFNHVEVSGCFKWFKISLQTQLSTFLGGEPQKTRHQENQGGLQQWLLPLLLYWQPCLDGNGMLEGKLNQGGLEGIQSAIQFLHLRWVKKNGTKHTMMNFHGFPLPYGQSFHHMANSEPKITHLQQIPWRKGGRFSGWRFFQPGSVQGCQISCIYISGKFNTAMENPPFWMVFTRKDTVFSWPW